MNREGAVKVTMGFRSMVRSNNKSWIIVLIPQRLFWTLRGLYPYRSLDAIQRRPFSAVPLSTRSLSSFVNKAISYLNTKAKILELNYKELVTLHVTYLYDLYFKTVKRLYNRQKNTIEHFRFWVISFLSCGHTKLSMQHFFRHRNEQAMRAYLFFIQSIINPQKVWVQYNVLLGVNRA